MTNGYIVLTKGEPNLYKHAIEAISLGKPIYFVDAENKTIYFGTTILLVGTDVVINSGNATVTIETDDDVTITSTASHLYLNRIQLSGDVNSNTKTFKMLVYDNVAYTSEMLEQNPSILDKFDYLPICDIDSGENWYFEDIHEYNDHLEGNVYYQGNEESFDTETLSISVISVQIF